MSTWSCSAFGPSPTPWRTQSTSIWSRSACSTQPGIFVTPLRMISTCSLVRNPIRWATATASSFGASTSPVTERRGPSRAAWVSRIPASLPESRHRVASTSRHDLAPISTAVVCCCNWARPRCRWASVRHADCSSASSSVTVSAAVSVSRSHASSSSWTARSAATAASTRSDDMTRTYIRPPTRKLRAVTAETQVTHEFSRRGSAEVDALRERQLRAVVDGVGGAAHVRLPRVRPGLAGRRPSPSRRRMRRRSRRPRCRC